MNYYTDVLKKYAVFNGRATRKEFWMFILCNSIIGFIISLIPGIPILFYIGGKAINILSFVYGLAVLIPSLAVYVRRLHDTGHSGWWLFSLFVPILGIVVFVFWLLDSKPGDNKYGPNPKGITATENIIQNKNWNSNKNWGIANIIVGVVILLFFIFILTIFSTVIWWIGAIASMIDGVPRFLYIINGLFAIFSIIYFCFAISLVWSGVQLLRNRPRAERTSFISGLGLLLSCGIIVIIRLAINYLPILSPLRPTTLPFVGSLGFINIISLIYPLILIFFSNHPKAKK